MKIFPFSFLLSLILFSCSLKQNIPQQYHKPIKSNLIAYKYVFGKPDTSGIIKETRIFNVNGKDSIQIVFDENGKEKSKTFLKYDTLNNLEQKITYDTSGKVILKGMYSYDNYGLMLSSKVDNADGAYNYETYFYNNKKLIRRNWEIKSYSEFPPNWHTSKYIIEMNYDLRDSLISEKFYSDKKLAWEFVYRYDSLGRRIADDYKSNPRKFFYDSAGNISEEISFSENGKQACRWERKYDSRKNLIEQIKYNSLNEPAELEKIIFYFN